MTLVHTTRVYDGADSVQETSVTYGRLSQALTQVPEYSSDYSVWHFAGAGIA